MGGDEEPCQPRSLLKAIEEETGHPCPRRESYNADDGLCLELLGVATSPFLAPAFGAWSALLLRGIDEEHQLRLLRRVAAATADEAIAKRLPRPRGW
jgi:hypothetical protein